LSAVDGGGGTYTSLWKPDISLMSNTLNRFHDDVSDHLVKYAAKFCIGACILLIPCLCLGWVDERVQPQH